MRTALQHFDLGYNFSEKIINESCEKNSCLYDKSFLSELDNIEKHPNKDDYEKIPVHYVISCQSIDAASDMTEALMYRLLKANRIRSRRMEIISEISPKMYEKENHLEQMIEYNRGGAIVFDLTEDFGTQATQYSLVCDYIEKLVKKYHNECLFVFTYNINNTGFAYYLLPKLEKYIYTINLREGTGDREKAVQFLKELIKASECAK